MTFHQIRYRQRKNSGLCPACGKVRTAGTGHVICDGCRERCKTHQNARHARCTAAGVCCMCGRADDRTQAGHLYCLDCEAARSNSIMARYDNDVYGHRCTRCHQPLPEGYTKLQCASCLALQREYARRRKERETNGSRDNVQTAQRE